MSNKSMRSSTTESAHINKLSNLNSIHLSPAEKRIVKLLLIEPQISYDLEDRAYCRHAADNIRQIRHKGIEIITKMMAYERKTDGKVVRVGQYRIAENSIAKAHLAIT